MHARRIGWLTLALLGAAAVAAQAQPYIFGTGYEEYAAGDEVMFQEPRFSGSTDGIHIGQTSLAIPYDDSQVVLPTGDWCPGGSAGCLSDAAYEISFAWRDPTDATTAGVRCTTLSTLNLNRPSLHLEGIIRFKMAVTVFGYEGDIFPDFPIGFQDQSGNPKILMCLAITETGRDLPLGTPDTGGGDIEYVYLPLSEVIPAADPNGMGTFPPGGKRFSATTNLWPPEDTAFVNVEIDLSAVTSAQLRGFANNGDGIDTAGDGLLDATINPTGHGANRGVLESIIFTNDVTDPNGEYFFIYIDDLEFEAPVADPTPPPTVVSPILRNATSVTVINVSTNATEVKLIVDNGDDPDQIITTTGVTSVVFTLPHPAIAGDIYTATQTVDGLESSQSTAVRVSFPGPYIGRLPKDGDTDVRVIDLNTQASAVELFVDDISRGVTPVPTNGLFEITVSTGVALEMGEVVHAIQVVDSAESDVSHVVTVTTSGLVSVFCDDFEYANQAAFDAVWKPTVGDLQLQLSSAFNSTTGGGKSALSDTTGSGLNANQSQLITEFGPITPTNTHPIIWNVSFYDNLVQDALYRQWAELRSTAAGTNPIIAMGKSNELVGTYYSGRVFGGSQTTSFFRLDGFGQPLRSNGWHVLTAVIKATTVDFYVDGDLAAVNRTHSAGQQIATALIGSGLSSAGGEGWYDDVCVEVGALRFNVIGPQPPPPPTVQAPILPGATSITVVDVDSTGTLVTLHRNGSGTPVVPGINPNGNTSVAFTVPAAIGGDYYTARQTVGGLTSSDSAQVFVLLPGPTLYKAPAQGESSVRVLGILNGATLVEVLVNGVVRGSMNPAGANDVVVPLSSFTLTMGEEVTARMTVSGIQSVPSALEYVTTDQLGAVLLCDTFESYANQAAFEVIYERVNFTSSPNETIHVLNTENNATPSGSKSLKSLNTAQYRTTPKGNPFAGIQGTNNAPVVFNVSIYDPTGQPGPDEWASMINWSTLGGGTDFFLAEIGLCTNTFSGGPETHYQGRLIGNGPFNWFQLDQFDGPTRSIGWHVFTMVFKGPLAPATAGHRVDIYVDGLLARKNMVLTENTLMVSPMIGSGQTSSDGTYYDDYCAQLGPVRFNEAPGVCLSYLGDMDGDGDVDLADVSAYVACIEGPTVTFADECGCADLNDDDVVDLKDYALLQDLLE